MLAIRRRAVGGVGILLLMACGAASDATGPGGGPSACATSGALTIGLGQVITPVSGTSLCVAAGSGHQEYVLVPFYGSQSSSATTALTVTGTGLDTATLIAPTDLVPSANLAPRSATLGDAAPAIPDRSFDTRLRQMERRDLTRLFPAARAAYASRSSNGWRLANVIPATVQVGDIVNLNSNAKRPCDSAVVRGGRVAAVTQKTIIVSDTANPTGGFTDAQYQSIGAAFDTLVYDTDVNAFGTPTDIDGNGHIILFFTKAVNDLTPKTSSSYVGGFFFARDLFPTTATTDLSACAASNTAEMFYLMVPDPTRDQNIFSQANVFQNTIGTTAHEFQHLINAARRLYVNTTASDFEAVWLNEGLSHVAEELMFYRVSGFAPRQDIDSIRIRTSARTVAAFNDYEGDNFGRYREFLLSPSKNSPYANNDSLETRGATWSMLRYLADHQGSGDGNQWFQLVNSTTEGIPNLKNVFGADVMTHVRDWATSVYTDNLTAGVGNTWQQPSWNFRSVYGALKYAAFPLQLQTLTAGTAMPLTLVAGGSAYLRFATAANKDALIQWSASGGQAPPAEVQFSVVRVK